MRRIALRSHRHRDHGKLIALDSPLTLKAAIAGVSRLEVSFATTTPGWPDRLAKLPGVDQVQA